MSPRGRPKVQCRLEYSNLERINGVPANLIGWYMDIHVPSINGKLHLVTGFFGGLTDHLIVEAIGKRECDDLNHKFAFQSLLAAVNLVMQPGGIILPPRCVAYIVLRYILSTNVNATISHLDQLRP